MATTETKSGFRLPWGADQRTDGADATGADATAEAGSDGDPASTAQAPATASGWPSDDPVPTTTEGHSPSEPADDSGAADAEGEAAEAQVHAQADPTATETSQDAMIDTTSAPTGSAAKRPTKFMADLTNAMRSAAESQRAEIVGAFEADAKAYTELIHERSGAEATDLRKRADDDIAGIRDWSKAEIARIREETDERISHRRNKLEKEVEAHAARIESEVERVKHTVDRYEREVADFFEELGGIDDPGRFASVAAQMPEPPDLDAIVGSVATELAAAVETPTSDAAKAVAEPVAESVASAEVVDEPEVVAEPAPAAEAASQSMTETAGETAAPSAPDETDGTDASDEEVDPRVAALGLTPDFAAAEAEAMADVESADAANDGSDDGGEPIPALDDETIAARLAGLVPPSDAQTEEAVATRLVVTGLVSVASIAGFKRHLARLAGVRSVGVSSGPDGEFVFAISHDPSVDLRDVVPTMPGFAARVTGGADGTLTVSATDPESDS